MSQRREAPVYRGMRKHVDQEGGYALWLPSDWHRFEMVDGHHGMVFRPNPEDPNTCLTAEKVVLPYKVKQRDMPSLREGFCTGLDGFAGVEIESQDESVTSTFLVLEARFTFLDGDVRRKRWTRVAYWGEGQLILIAQGSTPAEFEYWLPMFYNTMMTLEV